MRLFHLYTRRVMTIKEWLQITSTDFKKAGIMTSLLDSEVLLAHVLCKPRTYLHAHAENSLSRLALELANECAFLRLKRVPLAYIIGHKEFYDRRFIVTPDVLIPRPESEAIIELVEKYQKTLPHSTFFDIGTGSGCLAITIKLALPHCFVTASDISDAALEIAKKNATRLQALITFIKSDILKSIPMPRTPIYLLANLPYVDPNWETSLETAYEPRQALYAPHNGLKFINQLCEQSSSLPRQSIVCIESDIRQHAEIIKKFSTNNFLHLETCELINVFQRI